MLKRGLNGGKNPLNTVNTCPPWRRRHSSAAVELLSLNFNPLFYLVSGNKADSHFLLNLVSIRFFHFWKPQKNDVSPVDFRIPSKRHKVSVRDLTENPADNQAIKVLFPVVVVTVTLLEFQQSYLQKDKYWICQSSGQYAQNTGAFKKSVLVVKKP